MSTSAVRGHIRGALVLFSLVCILVLGFPGLDAIGESQWRPGSAKRKELVAQPGGFLVAAAADLNRAVRMPIVRALTPLQRPLRLAQTWGLYPGGPHWALHMEISVDERLVYRSEDPEYTWLRSTLHYRRIRPMGDAICHATSKNRRGFIRYITRRARQDYPDATRVDIRCFKTAWPGTGKRRQSVHHVSEAPAWGGS